MLTGERECSREEGEREGRIEQTNFWLGLSIGMGCAIPPFPQSIHGTDTPYKIGLRGNILKNLYKIQIHLKGLIGVLQFNAYISSLINDHLHQSEFEFLNQDIL